MPEAADLALSVATHLFTGSATLKKLFKKFKQLPTKKRVVYNQERVIMALACTVYKFYSSWEVEIVILFLITDVIR